MATRSKKVPVKKKSRKTAAAAPPSPAAYHPLVGLRQEMDRLFERFMGDGGPFGSGGLSRLGDWDPFRSVGIPSWFGGFGPSPSVDLSESEKSFELTMELPGMEADDVELELSGDALTVKGEKRKELEKQEQDYHLTERSFGQFRRTFTLPSGVEADKIGAAFSKGVLTVTVPKLAEATKQRKRIEVKTG